MAEIFPASTAADAHRRKMCGENFLHIIRNTACTAVRRSDTVVPKPKGPVLENTFGSAVAAPTESGVLSRPDFLGVCPRLDAPTVSDGMGLSARQAALLNQCFQHPVHPLRLKTWRVALNLVQEPRP